MGESLESRLVEQFAKDFKADKIQLPILPDIAIRVKNALDKPNVSFTTIAKLIQSDAAIAARVLRVANSVAYKSKQPVDNLVDAISRIGYAGTSNVINSLTLVQLFQTRSSHLRKKMNELWAHSIKVAAISHVLASLTPSLDPNTALFAGLVHDIGVVPILTYAEKFPELTADTARLDALLAQFKGQAGAMLLDRWGFDPSLGTVAAEAEVWARDTAEKPDYCDLVILAQLHSFVGKPEFSRLPRIDTLPAFRKIAPGELGPKQSLQMLDDADADIREVISLLKS